jgi:gliding motility-associated-like protein
MKLNQSNVCYSSEDSVMVEVQPVPSVSFNYEPGPHCVGEAIGFTAQSNPPGLIVTWDFGDSASPAGNQLDYSFDTSGVFLVSARVQDGPACADTASQQVLVDYLPSSEIEAEVLNLCPGEPIQLSAGDNSGNAVFTWNFGDNSAENGAQISHAFNNPNEQITAYTIVLTASNLQGTCFSSDSVQVQVYPSTNAAFDLPESLYCQHGTDPLQIIPQNLAQNATSYVWWLNNVEFSDAFEPVIEISSPGSYELKMRSENIFTCPDSALVIFEVQPAPVANFNLNSTVFCEGETLILQDQSQGVIVNWIWDSGNFIQDGSAVDSTILGLAGTFSVSLVVQDQNGCRDTLQQINAYTVYPTPEAGFTVSPAEIEVLNPGYSVNSFAEFNDFCLYEISDQDGVIDSCDFSSILEDPFQEFLTIVQTVTNVAGCEDKMIQNIRILPDFVLTAPSVFTPNGDGHNDVFKPILVNVSEEGFELLIFDRRGNIVFQTSSISDAWDGTLLGSDWNQADRMEYEIYTVKMKGRSMFDGRKREYDGKLKLVREGK